MFSARRVESRKARGVMGDSADAESDPVDNMPQEPEPKVDVKGPVLFPSARLSWASNRCH